MKDLHEVDNDAMTTEELTSHSTALATTHGCGGSDALACLRELNATQLSAEPFGRFAPAVDGHLVLGVPLHQVRAGAWKKQVRRRPPLANDPCRMRGRGNEGPRKRPQSPPQMLTKDCWGLAADCGGGGLVLVRVVRRAGHAAAAGQAPLAGRAGVQARPQRHLLPRPFPAVRPLPRSDT